METLFSVIIPAFRDWPRLQKCLDALGSQSLPPERFEVIVANNDAADTQAPFPLPANVTLINEPRPGSYAARNTAVALSKGRYLAFTDSDCVPDPYWLANGLRALEAHPGARVSGSVPIFREPNSSALAHLYEFHTAFRQREYASQGVCATANLLVSRQTFDKVGPFDGRIFSGGDFNCNHRPHDMGIPIFHHPEVIVRHPARQAVADIFRKRRRTARSEAVSGKHGLRGYVMHLMAPPFSRTTYDRGQPTVADKTKIFLLVWALGIYAASQFALVRAGIIQPVRS